jgi:hypothetical protein
MRTLRWRAYLRLTTVLVNGVFVFWLIGIGGWAYPIGVLGGVPFIVPPLLAIAALIISHRERSVTDGGQPSPETVPRAPVSVTSYRLSRLTTEPLFHRRGKTTFQRKGVFVYLVLGDVRRRKLALMTSRFPSRLQHPVNAPITKKCFRKCDSTGERVCTESPSARKSGRLPP